MKGLELARLFYKEVAAPMIRKNFAGAESKIAVGLAGQGSECLGYDDEISRDHDFGPACCLWLSDSDYTTFGAELQSAYNALPHEIAGVSRSTTEHGRNRIGVMRINQFYAQYTGVLGAPKSDFEWLRIPEHYLSAAVSGEVFRDDSGEFSAIREKLLAFYPRDVKLKKLAARIFTMAQAGQYNFTRIERRGDKAASILALDEFARAALSALHILNNKYIPYYKWAFRSACSLPLLNNTALKTRDLLSQSENKAELIEEICCEIVNELRNEELSSSYDTFLAAHAEEIMRRIKSAEIAKLPVMAG